MCFDYVTIYHSKMKGTEFNLKNIKNFRIEWRQSSLKFEELINIGDTVLVLPEMYRPLIKNNW